MRLSIEWDMEGGYLVVNVCNGKGQDKSATYEYGDFEKAKKDMIAEIQSMDIDTV